MSWDVPSAWLSGHLSGFWKSLGHHLHGWPCNLGRRPPEEVSFRVNTGLDDPSTIVFNLIHYSVFLFHILTQIGNTFSDSRYDFIHSEHNCPPQKSGQLGPRTIVDISSWSCLKNFPNQALRLSQGLCVQWKGSLSREFFFYEVAKSCMYLRESLPKRPKTRFHVESPFFISSRQNWTISWKLQWEEYD